MNSKSSVGLGFFLWAETTTIVSDQTIHFFKTHCGRALGTWICSWLQMLNSHGVVSVRCTTTYVLVCYFCLIWNACILPFPERRLSRTLMVVLQIVCLHSAFSFMGVYALVFFHDQRLTNLISIQNMEDDGQTCHFMSWIVPFQNQFKDLSLPYCAKYSFIVQQYPVARDYWAFLPLCWFWPHGYTVLIQATQTIESAQLMKQKTPTWGRNLHNSICFKRFPNVRLHS